MDKEIINMTHNYKDIYVVEDFEEASQFRYEHNDETVEVGTAVAFDRPFVGMPKEKAPIGADGRKSWKMSKEEKPVRQMVCFDGIYFQEND